MNKLTTYCDCSDPAHSMEFVLFFGDGEEPELYVSVQLNPNHPWWKRIGYAVMYVLGKRSRFSYGHWDEGGISYNSAKELVGLLGRFFDEYNQSHTALREEDMKEVQRG